MFHAHLLLPFPNSYQSSVSCDRAREQDGRRGRHDTKGHSYNRGHNRAATYDQSHGRNHGREARRRDRVNARTGEGAKARRGDRVRNHGCRWRHPARQRPTEALGAPEPEVAQGAPGTELVLALAPDV